MRETLTDGRNTQIRKKKEKKDETGNTRKPEAKILLEASAHKDGNEKYLEGRLKRISKNWGGPKLRAGRENDVHQQTYKQQNGRRSTAKQKVA